ncbi:substrate-binding domain-containing protein [Altererythrobacter sp. RZ02]|uniref:Substrate-binding domain-containing protein n=1 Tax=Pontixanthobacter rizhaonensis TaxID=2730337 RepID=A0A848QK89_9SPHN|nr:substrate-binding domain-containing protein [Pontixanthobacter rizhaonensis]NMW31017.1 substrate-binding domain-containing protein [Pontixanthobacter rizhaonensis]
MSQILLLSDNVSKDYVERIVTGAAGPLDRSRYSLVARNVYGSDVQVSDLIDDQHVSGVILTPPLSDLRPLLSLLESRKLPFVRIAPLLDLDRGSSVTMDEFTAANAIGKHLIENGHRKIGFIRGPKEHLVSIRRYNGFAGALGGAGLKLDENLMKVGDFSRQSGRELASSFFQSDATALFASNDDMALGVMDAAQASGVSIPLDMSIVGFDDNREAARANPGLTTVRQPLGAMGVRAAELIIERCQGTNLSNVVEEIPFELVKRGSVGQVEN